MNLTASALYLGPATVLSIEAECVRLAVPKGTVLAELALGWPYEPSPGDVVLAVGETDFYIIGILTARRKATLHFDGDLELRASGRLSLVGGQAVDITTPRATLRAERLETVAGEILTRAQRSYAWVEGVVSLAAGRLRSLVKGSAVLQAEQIVEKARGQVFIDGEQINLG